MSVDATNAAIAATVMANGMANAATLANQGFAASGQRRTDAADQLAADSQRMWSIAMTSPTVMAAHGMRTASESGAGRTRAETNLPGATSAAGNA
jgi:hypothetical protein